MYRLFAAALAAASCAAIAQAQTVPHAEADAALSLAQALAMAGVYAPGLDMAEADIRAASAGRAAAALRPNPSLTMEVENVAGSGLYRGAQSLEATTSLALPVELGGKRAARIGIAAARSQRAAIGAAIAQADLRLSVTLAYAEAAAAEQRLIAARDQAAIAAQGLRAAQLRVQAGRASPIEVQRADLARINADGAVERAGRLADVARYSLSRLIGDTLPAQPDDRWFAAVPDAVGPLKDIASKDTLALAAAEADLAIADAGMRLASAQRTPDLTAGVGARYLRETGDVAAFFSLSIPLPLFNDGGPAMAQASAERMGAEARQRVTALDVDQAIMRAQADAANAATAAATASGPALNAAREAARIARIGYREGKFGQLDLLDAERLLAETRLTAIDALLNYHTAQARLERLTARAPDLLED